ncbi:High-affinity fructose transporter [Lachnellula hyalina]|uniref:High-affinity fructose transporter n=1 Tax=Lachnellula hyalina TaxID=1316788 RepID=A0A8H8R6W7_9HELO|nr:High-affinity fructose transporter [Lachnellula hyalina]TVY29569.1 High-affinity fructose transporter [Lachnellula hyalina]
MSPLNIFKKNTAANGNAAPSPSESVVHDSSKDVSETEKGNGGLITGKIPTVTIRTVIMTLCVSMGGFIFGSYLSHHLRQHRELILATTGYDTGQISGFLEMHVFLQRFGEPTSDLDTYSSGYKFSNVRSGLIVGLLSIGTLIGALIAGPASNYFGRRPSIPFWCLIFCIGVVVQEAVGDGMWVGIAMGRWVAGLGVGALSVLVPLYMTETAPVPVRGAVVSCYQLFVTIGIFTADCINFGTEKRNDTGSYRIPMGVGFIWALILAIGIVFLPETPRFDWNHGRAERGLDTMTKFYGEPASHPMIQNEAEEIEKVMEATKGDHPWYEAITGPRMFYRIVLAMGLQMFQQLTGANYFFYYGTTVFSGVGIKNSFVTSMILGGVNVGATFFGVAMARRFRRRESLYIAGLWQCMCFLVFASVGQFIFKDAVEGSSKAKTSGTVMIVFACLFICGFASTWGPLVWACIGELFPYRYRAVGMGLATASNWFWNFLLAFFTPFITQDINFSYGYVFAGCNLFGAFMAYYWLIESSGRTLEEVDAMYLIHVSPRKSAKFQFDEDTKRDLGHILNTDAMKLERRGRKIKKINEAGQGGVFHEEGAPVHHTPNVTDMSNGSHPITSTGAA